MRRALACRDAGPLESAVLWTVRDARASRARGGDWPASPFLSRACAPRASEAAGAPAKLLLVDDRPENLLALEAILEPLDADLVRAASGEEALRRLLHEEFAAILLDVQMPGMDGFQTAELIKQRERTKHVPILFLTAISKDAEHIFRGYSAGAVDYLMKPFDPLILRAKVAVFIELWQKTVEIRRRDALLAEQELAAAEYESEVRYRSLADAVPQIVWTADADGSRHLPERALVRADRAAARRAGRLAGLRPPRGCAGRGCRLGRGPPDADAARRRVPDQDGRRDLPLVPRPARCRLPTAGSGRRPTSRTASSPRSGRRSSPRRAGCSAARSTTSRRSPTSRGSRCRAWRTGARSTSSSTASSSGSRSSTRTRSSSRSPASSRSRCSPAVAVATRTTDPVLVQEIDERALAAFRFNADQLEIARTLAPRSYVTVPLTARGEVFGSVTLVTAESGRVYGEEDAALAQELARHAAAAIDNARLYAESERRSRAARALEAVGDGVVLVDRDGVIRLWNTAATTITGVAEADTLGRKIEDVVHRWQEISPRIPVASKPGEPVRAETVPVEFGGRELWISGSGVGFEEGTVYAFRDLTEERALEEMKADFVATVSHELRTPLAAIYGSAQTIRRTDIDLDPQIHDQLLGVIASESDRLGTIVNDLLVAGRLDADQLPGHGRAVRSRASSRRRWSSRRGRISRSRSCSSWTCPKRSRASSPIPASCTRCSSTSSTTRSSTRPRAARSRSRSRTATARSASRSPTPGSGSRRRSTGGSSRSSTGSIPT